MQAHRLILVSLFLLTTAFAPSYAQSSQDAEADFDPFEGLNRAIFDMNHCLDVHFIRPVAEVYGFIPSPARKGVRNILTNLRSPVYFVNDLLHFDMEGAGQTMARVLINTTIGIGGLFDVATELGVEYHSRDSAETLADVGLPSGPYIVLPLLGPSTPRDILGRTADFFVNPVNYVIANNEWDAAYYAGFGLEYIDRRTEARAFTDEIEKAIDPYVRVRSLYYQSRVGNLVDTSAEDNDSPKPLTE